MVVGVDSGVVGLHMKGEVCKPVVFAIYHFVALGGGVSLKSASPRCQSIKDREN